METTWAFCSRMRIIGWLFVIIHIYIYFRRCFFYFCLVNGRLGRWLLALLTVSSIFFVNVHLRYVVGNLYQRAHTGSAAYEGKAASVDTKIVTIDPLVRWRPSFWTITLPSANLWRPLSKPFRYQIVCHSRDERLSAYSAPTSSNAIPDFLISKYILNLFHFILMMPFRVQ